MYTLLTRCASQKTGGGFCLTQALAVEKTPAFAPACRTFVDCKSSAQAEDYLNQTGDRLSQQELYDLCKARGGADILARSPRAFRKCRTPSGLRIFFSYSSGTAPGGCLIGRVFLLAWGVLSGGGDTKTALRRSEGLLTKKVKEVLSYVVPIAGLAPAVLLSAFCCLHYCAGSKVERKQMKHMKRNS